MRDLPTAWIRVDANKILGRGHLSRCLALADMIKEDWSVCFLMQASNQAFCEPLLADWPVVYFEHDDVLQTLLNPKDLLVVDSYAIDNVWRLKHRELVACLVDINDIPGKILGADIIINHCPGLNANQYEVEPDTVLLLGMEYAILRITFLAYAQTAKLDLAGEGVFICFGGADPYQLGHQAALSILQAGFEAPVWLVSSAESPLLECLLAYTNFHLLHNLSANQMKKYMLQSRVLLISASILSFEAVALRKPMLVLYYVDNQALIYKGLVENGMAAGFGWVECAKELINIATPFLSLYHSEESRRQMIKQLQKGIDGLSSERIRDRLRSEIKIKTFS